VARGSVVKRGKKYAVVLDLGRDADGMRIRKWHSGDATKKEAEVARTELLGRLDGGTYTGPTKVTVQEFVESRWLPALDGLVTGGTLRANTVMSYRNQALSYVVPNLGHVKLSALSADHLARFYGELSKTGRRKVKEGDPPKGLAASSVRLVHITVHRLLRDAVRWGLLARNVADLAAADVPRGDRQTEMLTWTPPQLRQYLDYVKDDRLRALWVLMVTTGIRRGEAAGLTWDCLDLDGSRLKVEKTRVVVNFKVVDSGPKTAKSGRDIGLDPQTVAALRSHRAQTARERMAWGSAHQQNDLVFTREDGSPYHPDVLTKTFQRTARAAGLPVIRLHDLRHSFATAALEAGVPLKVVSDRLGHASISITGDVYSHVRPEVDQEAANMVANLILGAG
jgi:integrase